MLEFAIRVYHSLGFFPIRFLFGSSAFGICVILFRMCGYLYNMWFVQRETVSRNHNKNACSEPKRILKSTPWKHQPHFHLVHFRKSAFSHSFFFSQQNGQLFCTPGYARLFTSILKKKKCAQKELTTIFETFLPVRCSFLLVLILLPLRIRFVFRPYLLWWLKIHWKSFSPSSIIWITHLFHAWNIWNGFY